MLGTYLIMGDDTQQLGALPCLSVFFPFTSHSQEVLYEDIWLQKFPHVRWDRVISATVTCFSLPPLKSLVSLAHLPSTELLRSISVVLLVKPNGIIFFLVYPLLNISPLLVMTGHFFALEMVSSFCLYISQMCSLLFPHLLLSPIPFLHSF